MSSSASGPQTLSAAVPAMARAAACACTPIWLVVSAWRSAHSLHKSAGNIKYEMVINDVHVLSSTSMHQSANSLHSKFESFITMYDTIFAWNYGQIIQSIYMLRNRDNSNKELKSVKSSEHPQFFSRDTYLMSHFVFFKRIFRSQIYRGYVVGKSRRMAPGPHKTML